MESATAETLENALSGREVEELQEMCKRLAKSSADLTEMFEELEAEKQSLKHENAQLNETISLMMKEMQKLKIGAGNTVEPRLDEGPLDFVGRFWEKVKPRDTAVVINEHVGEIKKPMLPGEGGAPNRQELGKQVVQKVSGAFGPIWQRAEGLLNAAQGELAEVIANAKAKPQPPAKGKRKPKGAGDGNDGSVANAQQVPAGASATESAGASSGSAGPAPGAEVAPAAVPAQENATHENDATGSEQKADADDDKDQIGTTILIEARLRIDDGSVHTLNVRAADRCKEVAHRFVQEHSLKAWFEEPLTAWLKKVEADADKFPVMIEADLLEIRKQHQQLKGKAG